jgi:hypothetical protein
MLKSKFESLSTWNTHLLIIVYNPAYDKINYQAIATRLMVG